MPKRTDIKTVLIIGAGPIGTMVAIAALAGGCARAIVADLAQPFVGLGRPIGRDDMDRCARTEARLKRMDQIEQFGIDGHKALHSGPVRDRHQGRTISDLVLRPAGAEVIIVRQMRQFPLLRLSARHGLAALLGLVLLPSPAPGAPRGAGNRPAGPGWRRAVETAHGILVTGGSEQSVLIRPDGSVVWVLLSVSLARNALGEPRFLIAQVIDVSSRKDVEAWLRTQIDGPGA